jgi:capsid assembly protease
MRSPHLFARAYNTPLMIHPDKAAVIERIVQAHMQREPIAPPADAEPRQVAGEHYAALDVVRLRQGTDKPYALTESGLALIPVMGTLVQRASGLDAMSGLTGYNRIERLITAAMLDRDVRAILLEIDSPGGEAAGVFDLAALIEQARAEKRITAVANELAASAAYAIAASASKLYAPATAMVGSIGVIALHVDQSKRDQSQGYAYTAIYAGARKNDLTSHQPLNAEGRSFLQESVDHTYGIFVEAVARARGLSASTVRRTEAAVYDAERALAIGLIDGIDGYNTVLARLDAELSGGTSPTYFGTRMAASHPSLNQERTMSTSSPAAALTANTQPQQLTQADLDAAVSQARVEARSAERARVAAILGCDEAKGRQSMAQSLALEMDVTPEQAKKLLATAPVAALLEAKAENEFARAMGGVKNPEVGADAGKPAGGDDDSKEVARILQLVPTLTHAKTAA